MFYKIGFLKNFAKLTLKNTFAGVCAISNHKENPAELFPSEFLRSFSKYRTAFPISLQKPFDISLQCFRCLDHRIAIIFVIFSGKRLQLSLLFTMSFHFIFKYLKCQNKQMSSQTFSTILRKNFEHFL